MFCPVLIYSDDSSRRQICKLAVSYQIVWCEGEIYDICAWRSRDYRGVNKNRSKLYMQ